MHILIQKFKIINIKKNINQNWWRNPDSSFFSPGRRELSNPARGPRPPDYPAGQTAQPHPPATPLPIGQIRQPMGGGLCKYIPT